MNFSSVQMENTMFIFLLGVFSCLLHDVTALIVVGLPDVSTHENLRLLDHNLCGRFTDLKIAGGDKTGVSEYPWMALILYQKNGNSYTTFECAGSIINKRYILTAAHCVTSLSRSHVVKGVRVGEHNIRTEPDCDSYFDQTTKSYTQTCAEGFQDFGIESISSHHQFSRLKFQNDIALIRLNRNINFEPLNARPICLPIGTAATFYGNKATVTGWGVTENGLRSFTLLEVKIPIISNVDCSATYPKQNITYKQICAGGQTGSGACCGDSGGPLQNPGNYNSTSRMVQYGIHSYGPRGCGLTGYPGIFTAVPYYMDWILNGMRI